MLPHDQYNPKRGVEALVIATGLSPAKVRAGIRNGELPGVIVGRSYIVPRLALEAFSRGEWTPKPQPITSISAPTDFIRRKTA